VQANGEIISTIISLRDETVFAVSTNVHRSNFDSIPTVSSISRWAAGSLHHNLKIETIIARALQYLVGHFIDCNPVTRRLLASLIDSSDAAKQAESNEHE
jgi:hypothetical protein